MDKKTKNIIKIYGTVIAILILFIISKSCKNNNKESENPKTSSIIFNSNGIEVKNKFYIEDGDTLAEFLNASGTMAHIWTNKKYEKEDEGKVSKIINHILPNYSSMTYFLYQHKVDGVNENENYYASYNNSILTIKKSAEELIEEKIQSIKEPIEINNIGSIMLFLDKVDKYSSFYQSNKDNKRSSEIRNHIINFQKKYFPIARKVYYENAKEKLWEKNIEVKLSGKNIKFIGYMFADNKTKKDTYKEIISELTNLRFKRVSFEWYDGSDTTYWDIDSKNDTEI